MLRHFYLLYDSVLMRITLPGALEFGEPENHEGNDAPENNAPVRGGFTVLLEVLGREVGGGGSGAIELFVYAGSNTARCEWVRASGSLARIAGEPGASTPASHLLLHFSWI